MTRQKKSLEVLDILRKASDNRECENQLILLLGNVCYDFVKLLLKNRNMILDSTLYSSANLDKWGENIVGSSCLQKDVVKERVVQDSSGTSV